MVSETKKQEYGRETDCSSIWERERTREKE